jgi:hypothetical protein
LAAAGGENCRISRLNCHLPFVRAIQWCGSGLECVCSLARLRALHHTPLYGGLEHVQSNHSSNSA